MIAELGHFALIVALVTAALQAAGPLAAALPGARSDIAEALSAMGRPAALAQAALIAFSFGCLVVLYVQSDFSVLNVWANSHSQKPLIYKITGTWGNHEGSMLLWVLILALFGATFALTARRSDPADGEGMDPVFAARVLGVQGTIGVAFLLFILLTSNPFNRVDPAPFDGRDLNPLLQDIGLAMHPPFLYLGYVGFSMAFSFAAAALIGGRVDKTWARHARPWTLAAWLFLTIGIMLGSWWAYYELGWGGWWFWDPVENASFMPWLLGTALLHSLLVMERRNALKHWTILLAILTFSMSLVGTFLVRSGVLTSVHAFANDPERGMFILLILGVFVGGALALYAWRAEKLSVEVLFRPVSREGALVFNNLMLTTACAVVFVGTLYPLFSSSLGLGPVSVGPPYFNAAVVPIFAGLLAALPAGAAMAWKRGDLSGVLDRLKWALALTALVMLVTVWSVDGGPILAVPAMGLAAWLVLGALSDVAARGQVGRVPFGTSLKRLAGLPRRFWGMTLAHGGLGIFVAGVVGASAWQTEHHTILSAGETIEIAGYTVTLESVEAVTGPNYEAEAGRFVITRNGRPVTQLQSERRTYVVGRRQTTEVGIHSTVLRDLYVVLGAHQAAAPEAPETDRWTVRAYHTPLMSWIWYGVAIVSIGGLASLSDVRWRMAAGARTARSGDVGQQPVTNSQSA